MPWKCNSKAPVRKPLVCRCYAGKLLRFFAKTLWRVQTDHQRGVGKFVLSPAASAAFSAGGMRDKQPGDTSHVARYLDALSGCNAGRGAARRDAAVLRTPGAHRRAELVGCGLYPRRHFDVAVDAGEPGARRSA